MTDPLFVGAAETVTPQAWQAGGYESLICRSARPSVEGVAMMVDKALSLLDRLWNE